ncbi:MAG: hypothetical protein RLN77_10545 [Rhodospirillales bacterium]
MRSVSASLTVPRTVALPSEILVSEQAMGSLDTTSTRAPAAAAASAAALPAPPEPTTTTS